jgi:uncharacterized damage-inducible protein DinB
MDPRFFIRQFAFNVGVVQQNTQGVTQAESLVTGEAGNCMNWVLAHMLATRSQMFQMLGLDPIWPADRVERFKRDGAPVTGEEEAVDLERTRRELLVSQKRLAEFLEEADPAMLDTPLDDPSPLIGETTGSALAFLAFHEAYHAGQLGLLRRLAGKPGAIQ